MNTDWMLCKPLATLVICGFFVSPVWAQGASLVLGGFRSLATEKSVLLTAQICSNRYPATAQDWKRVLAAFRKDNAHVLSELRTLAEQLKPDARAVLREFENRVPENFAMATEEEALDMCNQSLKGLPGASASLEGRLDQARRFVSLEK